MSFDFENDPRLKLEGIARDTADELVDTIVRAAQSVADVPAVIDRLVAYMRDQWQQEAWQAFEGRYGQSSSERADRWPNPFDSSDEVVARPEDEYLKQQLDDAFAARKQHDDQDKE